VWRHSSKHGVVSAAQAWLRERSRARVSAPQARDEFVVSTQPECSGGIALPWTSVTGRILVVSATAAEAAHLPQGTDVVVTGIGKVAAAAATTEALLARRDGTELTVLNIGTVGALHDGLSGVYLPSTVINHDINGDAIRGLGYDPRDLLHIEGGDGTVLASGDVFVVDPDVRRRLAARAQLVDMEGYAVAYACQRLGVPVRLIKHVSDGADESALDWPSVVDASARALGEWVAHLIGP
jgi:adenosylhomocysteine nucleosidase